MEINNYPNYLIYEDGRVFSKITNKFLKPFIAQGYYCISLGRKKKKSIHRLIAENFLENPNNYPEVDHIDRNPKNNNINNLRWVSRVDNQLNRGNNKNNSSGHKNIEIKCRGFYFTKRYKNKVYSKYFKTKKEALCYKYIFLLKIKSNII